jgi:ribosomal protein S18 acetylase RimI-like enzyme
MVTHPMYIVKISTEAVGTFSITWEDTHTWGKQESDAGYIHRLAVRHGFHGKGLGEAIINWAAAETKKQGRTLLRLDCPLDNKKLRAYYEKQGFIQVGTSKTDQVDGYTPALYERKI